MGNAAAVWTNGTASGARVMRDGAWVGKAVPVMDDPTVEGFWDIAVATAGGGEFELAAGAYDRARGVRMMVGTLGYAGGGTVLSDPVTGGAVPVQSLGAGQAIAMVRDVDGDLTLASTFWTDRPDFYALRRVGGVWTEPELLANGIVVVNNDNGMGLQPLALDSGGHVHVLTSPVNWQLWLRQIAKGGTEWTPGVRVDDEQHRYDGRGASVMLDENENPVVFWSAEGSASTNVAWTTCR